MYYTWINSESINTGVYNETAAASNTVQGLNPIEPTMTATTHEQRRVSNRYTAAQLRYIGTRNKQQNRQACSPELAATLKSAGIWGYRWKKGGKRTERRGSTVGSSQIPVVVGNRPATSPSHPDNRQPVLTPVTLTTSNKVISANNSPPPSVPSMYIINPTSLAKPMALQHLETDLASYNSDVVVVCETWFKLHHTNEAVKLRGYNCLYRMDRKGRKGGGVALYLKDELNKNSKSEVLSLEHLQSYSDKFEALWLKLEMFGRLYVICALYHPPSPYITRTAFLPIFLTV